MITLHDAYRILAIVSEYDQRFRGLTSTESETKAQAWTAAINKRAPSLDPQFLMEGATRAYAASDRRPDNPVGAVIKHAVDARRDASIGQTLAQITRRHGTPSRYPIKHLYEQWGALNITCPDCGATPGTWCTNTRTNTPRITPHTTRKDQP